MFLLNFIKKHLPVRPRWGFVSEVDLFMGNFRKQNPQKSASQLHEIKKHQRVFELRDNIKS